MIIAARTFLDPGATVSLRAPPRPRQRALSRARTRKRRQLRQLWNKFSAKARTRSTADIARPNSSLGRANMTALSGVVQFEKTGALKPLLLRGGVGVGAYQRASRLRRGPTLGPPREAIVRGTIAGGPEGERLNGYDTDMV